MKDRMLRPFRIIRDMWRFAREAHRVISITRHNQLLIEGENFVQIKKMRDDNFYHLKMTFKKIDDRIIIRKADLTQVNSPKHRTISQSVRKGAVI